MMLRYICRSSARLCARPTRLYYYSTVLHRSSSLNTFGNGKICLEPFNSFGLNCSKPLAVSARWNSSSQDSGILDETDGMAIDLDVNETGSVDPNEDIDALQPALDASSTEDLMIKQLLRCSSMSQV